MLEDLNFGTRTLQKYHTSYIIVVPKQLVRALNLKEGVALNFVLSREGVITLRTEVDSEKT